VAVIDTGPLRTVGEHRVRLTELEALANVRTVLELCATGDLRCSDKTGPPSSAAIRTVAEHLAGGDFYADDPIASFAWPLLVQAGGLVASALLNARPGTVAAWSSWSPSRKPAAA
jgi:hypothetical protein